MQEFLSYSVAEPSKTRVIHAHQQALDKNVRLTVIAKRSIKRYAEEKKADFSCIFHKLKCFSTNGRKNTLKPGVKKRINSGKPKCNIQDLLLLSSKAYTSVREHDSCNAPLQFKIHEVHVHITYTYMKEKAKKKKILKAPIRNSREKASTKSDL